MGPAWWTATGPEVCLSEVVGRASAPVGTAPLPLGPLQPHFLSFQWADPPTPRLSQVQKWHMAACGHSSLESHPTAISEVSATK